MRIWELMSATLAFLYHPDIWIRQGMPILFGITRINNTSGRTGSAAFISSAAKYLPSTDVWCILYPSLKHFLCCEIHTIDLRSLLLALKSAVSLVFRPLYRPL